MDSEQMRNYLLSGADDTPYEDMGKERAKQQWATGEVIRVLQEENARLKAGLIDIANADGGEGNVHGSLRWIEGYQEGVKTQAQRARAALGDSAPPQYPPSVLLARIERLEAALAWYGDSANYVVWLNDQDAAVMIDGGERARKALGGVP